MDPLKYLCAAGFAALLFVAGCATTQQVAESTSVSDSQTASFYYDENGMPGAKPWSSGTFKNDPRAFQFAVIGDRTGGANVEDTFGIAMDQLNLLQPEFVINVGDIIEGYSDDKAELTEMWEEAEALTARLEMPFFFTAGNHDMSNPVAREVWLERHGADRYFFIYQDVLFLVLNSEDGSRPEPPEHIKESIELYNRLQTEDPERARELLEEFMKDESVIAGLAAPVEFPPEQLAWIEQTLADYPDVRWTFLFTHEPVWEKPSESFREIQALLEERRFTWFAGHLHYYDYDNIDGHEYITMGPTGASFHHDGPGNVDHVTWVTMTDDGPQIGNIALKGVFDRKGLDPEMFGAYDRKGW